MKKVLVVLGILFAMFMSLVVAIGISETLFGVLFAVYFFAICAAIIIGLVKFAKKLKCKTAKKQKAAPQAAQTPTIAKPTPTIAETKQPTVQTVRNSAWKVHVVDQAVSQPTQPAPVAQETRSEKPAAAPLQTCKGYALRYHYDHLSTFLPNPQIIGVENVNVGDELTVMQDKGNLYDKTAVALCKNQSIISYLYKNNRMYGMANDWLDAGLPVLSKVSRLSSVNEKILHVELSFYGSPREKIDADKAYKLTRTANKATQDALVYRSKGDKLFIDEDVDGKYYVTDYIDNYGYLPASASALVDGHGGTENCHAVVAEIGMNDNFKYTISVYIIRGKHHV